MAFRFNCVSAFITFFVIFNATLLINVIEGDGARELRGERSIPTPSGNTGLKRRNPPPEPPPPASALPTPPPPAGSLSESAPPAGRLPGPESPPGSDDGDDVVPGPSGQS